MPTLPPDLTACRPWPPLRSPWILALTLIAMSTMPAAALADWSVSAAAQALYDDNVGNAQNYGDQVSDEIFGATLSAFQTLSLSDAYSLSAGADLRGEWFDHLNGLRNAALDGVLSLKRKWGLGAFAPWLRASLSLGIYGWNIHSNTMPPRQAKAWNPAFPLTPSPRTATASRPRRSTLRAPRSH
jgi:hypothetical protein